MSVIPQPYSNFKLGPPRKNAKESVLDSWRGMAFTTLEKTAAIRARKAGDVLPNVLKEMRMDHRRSEAEVVKVWNELIDPGITAHAQPTGLNKGTLFVTVDSSPWLDEIVRYRRKEILNRLQHSFGTDFVTRISFRLG